MKANLLCVTLQCLVLQTIVHCQNESSPCPAAWMVYAPNECSCPFHFEGSCYGDGSLEMVAAYCVSYDSYMQQLVTGLCPYSYYQNQYIKDLNSSVTLSQFNEVVCGPLKRKGRLCSRCKPGYGIPVFSRATDKCVSCDSKYVWPLYLALVLIPITLFYFLVIIFNFSATHPPVTAYTFYCQLFIQIVNNIKFIKHNFNTNTNKVLQNITWTVTAVWNLDMLQYIIPGFCLEEKFTTLDAIILELIPALYPILLIFVTLIFIEAHAHNIRVVVLLWKPFHKCFTFVRRAWDPRSSVTNAFATFLLLSSFKVCFATLNIVNSINVYFQNGTEIHGEALYSDPTILFRNLYKQAPLLILNIFVVILPMFLLVLHPTKLWRRVTLKLPGRIKNAIHLFMESFQGHYKNGTTGTYDYRAVSSFGFALRFLVGLILAISSSASIELNKNGPITVIAFLLIAVSLFYAHVWPCKRQYMNVIESFLYCTAGLVLITIIHNNHFTALYHLILAAILMPSVAFMGIVLYKVSSVFGIVKKIKRKFLSRRAGQGSGIDETEPHRLTHPTHYTPLLK